MTPWSSGKAFAQKSTFEDFRGSRPGVHRFFISSLAYETVLTDLFLHAYTMYRRSHRQNSFPGVVAHPVIRLLGGIC